MIAFNRNCRKLRVLLNVQMFKNGGESLSNNRRRSTFSSLADKGQKPWFKLVSDGWTSIHPFAASIKLHDQMRQKRDTRGKAGALNVHTNCRTHRWMTLLCEGYKSYANIGKNLPWLVFFCLIWFWASFKSLNDFLLLQFKKRWINEWVWVWTLNDLSNTDMKIHLHCTKLAPMFVRIRACDENGRKSWKMAPHLFPHWSSHSGTQEAMLSNFEFCF